MPRAPSLKMNELIKQLSLSRARDGSDRNRTQPRLRERACRSASSTGPTCPSIIWMARRSAPRSSRCVANEWRSTRGLRPRAVPAGAAVLFENFPESDAAERSAARVHEQTRRGPAFEQRLAPPSARILRHPRRRLAANRHQPFLAALADARRVLLVQVEVRHANRDQPRDPHAGGVEQLDHRAIAKPQRRRQRRGRDQRIDFVEREELRAATATPAAGAGPPPGCDRSAGPRSGNGRSRGSPRPGARPSAATGRRRAARARTPRARRDRAPRSGRSIARRVARQRGEIARRTLERQRRPARRSTRRVVESMRVHRAVPAMVVRSAPSD